MEITEEKKKERKKEPKKISPVFEFSAMKLAFSEWKETQKALMESFQPLKTFMEPSALKAFKQSLSMHKAMLPVVSSIFAAQQSILQTFQSSSKVLETFVEFRKEFQELAETYLAINKALALPREIAIAKITPKMETIPSRTKTVVNSLLRHIDFLEKELAIERAKNKELLRILRERGKELKKYVT